MEGAAAADDSSVAQFGIQPPPLDALALWPENADAVRLFEAMATQWTVGGMGGLIGLRYEALPAVLRFLGVGRAARGEAFWGLRVMEAAALEISAARAA